MNKKIYLVLLVFFVFFTFSLNANAMSLYEIKNILEKPINLNLTGKNSVYWNINDDSEIAKNIKNQIKNLDEEVEMTIFDYDYHGLSINISKFNEETNREESALVHIPFKLSGIVIESPSQDGWSYEKGDDDAFTVYEIIGKKKTLLTVKKVEYKNKGVFEIKNNRTKALKKGASLAKVTFTNGKSIEVICFVNLNIDESPIYGLSSYNLVRDASNKDMDTKTAIENALVEEYVGNYFPYTKKSSLTTIDEENKTIHISFDVNYAGIHIYFNTWKRDIPYTESGIIFDDVDSGSTIDLEKNDEYAIKYKAWDDVYWTSSDSSIASVNDSGVITAHKSGISIVKASYEGGYKYFVVRVLPDEDFINNFSSQLTQRLEENDKVLVKAISSLDNTYLNKKRNAAIADLVNEVYDDSNVVYKPTFLDNNKVSLAVGYTYNLKIDDNNYKKYNYCSLNSNDNGFDCGFNVEFDFTYPDNNNEFDNSLVTSAQSLMSNVENKIYPSYLEFHYDEYLDLDNNDAIGYANLLIKNTNLDELVANEDGFQIKVDANKEISFGQESLSGYCALYKDDIAYAVVGGNCGVKQVLRIKAPIYDTYDSAVEAYKNVAASEEYPEDVYTIESEFYIGDPASVNYTSEELEEKEVLVNAFILIKKVKEAPRVSTVGDNKSLTLNWQEVENASSYDIMRSASKTGKYSLIKSNYLKTSYIDKNVNYGKTYYYKVKAKGKGPKTSSIVGKKVIPNQVKNLTVTKIIK